MGETNTNLFQPSRRKPDLYGMLGKSGAQPFFSCFIFPNTSPPPLS